MKKQSTKVTTRQRSPLKQQSKSKQTSKQASVERKSPERSRSKSPTKVKSEAGNPELNRSFGAGNMESITTTGLDNS